MKHLLNAMVALLLAAQLPLIAMSPVDFRPSSEPIDEVREQIIELIGHPDLGKQKAKQMESILHFMVTAKNELVVLMVDTEHEFLDRYLKQKLNYKKVLNNEVVGRYAMKIILKNGSK